ncbi:uteroglobin-like [Ornithorhynchus anatinus]|uniref:uteroglobin-like n=1 Tax=Ornithorhynchus anatinus TaxID=9258 RepID=UPI0010A85C98|nr:uteroglobin-like [Ornithorhynchus anatinus]
MKVTAAFVLLVLGLFCSSGPADACDSFRELVTDYAFSEPEVYYSHLNPFNPTEEAQDAMVTIKRAADSLTYAQKKEANDVMQKVLVTC